MGSAILLWAFTGNFPLDSCQAQEINTDLISTSPDNTPTAGALPSDLDPNSPLAQAIRLLQAGVEQSVILTYISNAASPFNLSADQIIYLNDLGAPPEIANAMMQRDQQLQPAGAAVNTPVTPPPTPAETTATQPADVTVNYFYDTLAPYGGWVNVAGYGWCWRPTIVSYNTGWQPYCDDGHWVYTDSGWYWISGYSWGWATFHYGRWFQIPRYGWCWWPDTTWAPSWVCWRYNRDYCGWAPLPPHAVYQSGVGFVYQGRAVSAGFNFDLNANAFTFVATKDFCDPQPRRHRIEGGEMTHVYNQTTVINNFNFDSRHQGMVNAGIPPQDIAAVTRQTIHPVTIHAGNGSVAWSGRGEQFERNDNTLTVNRPHFVGIPVLSLPQGAPPTTVHRQNEFHPGVQGNQNPVSPHAENPGLPNPPQQDIRQNSYPNFNRTPPRVPQTQQPDLTHVTPANPQANNNTVTVPPRNNQTWPAQNPALNHHDSSGPSPSPGTTDNAQPHGNAVIGQPSSSPSGGNQYSPPPQNNNHGPPVNEVRADGQHFNHSDPPPPHPSYHAAPSTSQSSGKPGQDKDNGQGGH